MNFIKKNAHIIIIISLAVAIIGLFLPFIKASAIGITMSARYIEGDGVFLLILDAVALVFIILDMLKKINNKKLTFIVMIITIGLSILLPIIDVSRVSSNDYVSLGIGFWIILIGNIVALAITIINKVYQKPTNRQNF